MNVELMAPVELVPYAKNPRKNQPAVDYVANSIREFGFRNPILIDKDNVIIAGHTRLLAAEKLGIKQVPVIRIEDLTPDQVKALRLADNKTGEFAEWDRGLLDEELADLRSKLDMDLFGLGKVVQNELAERGDFFSREVIDGTARQEGNDEYNEFLDKFEPKKTTDDCYTPGEVYDVIAGWVASKYALSPDTFVRPFYPGGDYQHYEYPDGCVVVDNPPFSILSEIVSFYRRAGQHFFLFAPGLTCLGHAKPGSGVCAVVAHAQIVYENGAQVLTSFLTDMQPGILAQSAPDLCAALKAVQKQDKAQAVYQYPPEVLTSAMLGYISVHGVDYTVREADAFFIRKLDAQQDSGIYGSGLLLSEKAAAEKAARDAKDAKDAKVWRLSAREKKIIAGLGKVEQN